MTKKQLGHTRVKTPHTHQKPTSGQFPISYAKLRAKLNRFLNSGYQEFDCLPRDRKTATFHCSVSLVRGVSVDTLTSFVLSQSPLLSISETFHQAEQAKLVTVTKTIEDFRTGRVLHEPLRW